MLLGGDEIGRTQQGNNNAYCQDNEISWYDWNAADQDLLEFTSRVIEFYKKHPVFRRRRFFQGKAIHGSEVKDIGWFTPDGKEMTEENWGEGFAKSIGIFLNGEAIPSPNARGERIQDDSFYFIFNAHHESLAFTLPESKWGQKWKRVFATEERRFLDSDKEIEAGGQMEVQARSLAVLQRSQGPL